MLSGRDMSQVTQIMPFRLPGSDSDTSYIAGYAELSLESFRLGHTDPQLVQHDHITHPQAGGTVHPGTVICCVQ